MSEKKYTALILGANGLIGNELLHFLIKNERYSHIYTVSRNPINIVNEKITQIIADYNSIEDYINDIQVDILFCCIGSTKSKTPNKEEYYKIDHDYPVLVAKKLKNNGCEIVSLVSSIGANKDSNNFYLKLKGDVEESFKSLNIKTIQIFRPSLLIGKRKEKRLLEGFAQFINPLLDLLLIGKYRNYKSIKAETVAKAMSRLAIIENSGVFIFQTEDIKQKA